MSPLNACGCVFPWHVIVSDVPAAARMQACMYMWASPGQLRLVAGAQAACRGLGSLYHHNVLCPRVVWAMRACRVRLDALSADAACVCTEGFRAPGCLHEIRRSLNSTCRRCVVRVNVLHYEGDVFGFQWISVSVLGRLESVRSTPVAAQLDTALIDGMQVGPSG